MSDQVKETVTQDASRPCDSHSWGRKEAEVSRWHAARLATRAKWCYRVVGNAAVCQSSSWVLAPLEHAATNRITLPTSAMASSHDNLEDLRAAKHTRLPRAPTYPPVHNEELFDHTSCTEKHLGTLRCFVERDGACASPSSSLHA